MGTLDRRPSDDAVTSDGSPVLLYRRLLPGDEPSIIDAAVPRHASILELGAGAGRITHALTDLGHRVVAVDQSRAMLEWIHGAETVTADIEDLDLHRRFDVVILASHLVNTTDDQMRAAFLATCRRHVAAEGVVLIEHHEEDWAETVRDSRAERDGLVIALTEVERAAPFVSATMVYEIDRQTFRQPFAARVLSSGELSDGLQASGLRLRRRLTPKWAEAVPILPDDQPPSTTR